uniref:cyclin-dependent kinase 11B-like n=1 Tax=Myxine glutinosa TaxID=7769 RepID=UPI00358EE0D5
VKTLDEILQEKKRWREQEEREAKRNKIDEREPSREALEEGELRERIIMVTASPVQPDISIDDRVDEEVPLAIQPPPPARHERREARRKERRRRRSRSREERAHRSRQHDNTGESDIGGKRTSRDNTSERNYALMVLAGYAISQEYGSHGRGKEKRAAQQPEPQMCDRDGPILHHIHGVFLCFPFL